MRVNTRGMGKKEKVLRKLIGEWRKIGGRRRIKSRQERNKGRWDKMTQETFRKRNHVLNPESHSRTECLCISGDDQSQAGEIRRRKK